MSPLVPRTAQTQSRAGRGSRESSGPQETLPREGDTKPTCCPVLVIIALLCSLLCVGTQSWLQDRVTCALAPDWNGCPLTRSEQGLGAARGHPAAPGPERVIHFPEITQQLGKDTVLCRHGLWNQGSAQLRGFSRVSFPLWASVSPFVQVEHPLVPSCWAWMVDSSAPGTDAGRDPPWVPCPEAAPSPPPLLYTLYPASLATQVISCDSHGWLFPS